MEVGGIGVGVRVGVEVGGRGVGVGGTGVGVRVGVEVGGMGVGVGGMGVGVALQITPTQYTSFKWPPMSRTPVLETWLEGIILVPPGGFKSLLQTYEY